MPIEQVVAVIGAVGALAQTDTVKNGVQGLFSWWQTSKERQQIVDGVIRFCGEHKWLVHCAGFTISVSPAIYLLYHETHQTRDRTPNRNENENEKEKSVSSSSNQQQQNQQQQPTNEELLASAQASERRHKWLMFYLGGAVAINLFAIHAEMMKDQKNHELALAQSPYISALKGLGRAWAIVQGDVAGDVRAFNAKDVTFVGGAPVPYVSQPSDVVAVLKDKFALVQSNWYLYGQDQLYLCWGDSGKCKLFPSGTIMKMSELRSVLGV